MQLHEKSLDSLWMAAGWKVLTPEEPVVRVSKHNRRWEHTTKNRRNGETDSKPQQTAASVTHTGDNPVWGWRSSVMVLPQCTVGLAVDRRHPCPGRREDRGPVERRFSSPFLPPTKAAAAEKEREELCMQPQLNLRHSGGGKTGGT